MKVKAYFSSAKTPYNPKIEFLGKVGKLLYGYDWKYHQDHTLDWAPWGSPVEVYNSSRNGWQELELPDKIFVAMCELRLRGRPLDESK